MLDRIPFAQPGDQLVVFFRRFDEELEQRLRLVDSDPPVFRRIAVDREPMLSVNGYVTPVLWVPEAGGLYVCLGDQEYAVPFGYLKDGTELSVVSYAR